MEQSRKRMKFEVLFERYFLNFPRIMLTNLMFFVPLAIALALFWVVGTYTNTLVTTLFSILAVTLVFPFFAGVVLVVRNIARGDENVKVFQNFFKGVKENFFKFMLYGFLLSIVTVLSYYSISIYAKMLSTSWLFYGTLFVCILIALAVLFIFFYVPVMTVTFELKLKNIFKNGFLMSFGEIKNNFKALISLVVVIAFCLTLVMFASIEYLIIAITLLLLALIVPATCQFVVSFYVYDDMYLSVADKDTKSKSIGDAILDAKNKKNGVVSEADVEDYSDVDISTLKDSDDFIFYNGKMIKQSELLKRVLAQREADIDKKEEV